MWPLQTNFFKSQGTVASAGTACPAIKVSLVWAQTLELHVFQKITAPTPLNVLLVFFRNATHRDSEAPLFLVFQIDMCLREEAEAPKLCVTVGI